MPSDCNEELATTSPSVRDRGRGRPLIGRACDDNNGVVALIGDEIDDAVELVVVVLGMVW